MITIQITKTTLSTMQRYAYAMWAKEYDELEVCKIATWESQGKFCPKAEWPMFHEEQMKNAKDREMKAKKVFDELAAFGSQI